MTSMIDPMSPQASPNTISQKVGVRRVNNMPLFIGIGLVTMFVILMALVAFDRAAKKNRPAEPKFAKTVDTNMYANEIAGTQKDGIIAPKLPSPVDMLNLSITNDKTGTALPTSAILGLSPLQIARPTNLDTPPLPPDAAARGLQAPMQLHPPQQFQTLNAPRHDEADRIRTLKLQQFEEAVKSKTGVRMTLARSTGASGLPSGTPASREETLARIAAVRQQIDATTREDPTAAYKARLQQVQASLSGGGGGGGAGNGGATPSRSLLMPPASAGRNDVGQFAGSGQGDRWRLNSQPEAPRTPYELRAGFVVPATLISGVNSDLPGQIMAQVSQNVFDTATGKWTLIPQGSRLVGTYSSDVGFGQARILVAWQRIVFPDGKAMDIGSMPGADSAGYAGFSDQTNNHYFRIFASAFLMSGITAGISMSQPQANAGTTVSQTTRGALSETLGQQLGQVSTKLIEKNMNIAPTLEIRPGYRFNIVVTKDMTFTKPYEAFDY